MEFDSPFDKLERASRLCQLRIKEIEKTIEKLKELLKGSMDPVKEDK